MALLKKKLNLEQGIKKEYFIIIMRSIHQEDIKILNIHALKNSLKIHEAKLIH